MQITKYLIESIGPYTKMLPKKFIFPFHFYLKNPDKKEFTQILNTTTVFIKAYVKWMAIIFNANRMFTLARHTNTC